MKESVRKSSQKEAPRPVAPLQLIVPLAVLLQRELRDFVIGHGTQALSLLLEEERGELCGPAYARGREDGPRRAGSATGELVMGGRKVRVRRPRVRQDGQEVQLPSWTQFASTDPLQDRALEQMVLGVSTRKYHRSLESLPQELEERSTSRSSVSRRFKARTQQQLQQWLSRSLEKLRLTTIMIDGLHIDDHVVLLALGIDEAGHKHILGLWEGATENKRVCKALLRDLLGRNLDAHRRYLFVIDGSKALHSAIKSIFGADTPIQRCQEHKKRNVLDQLPKHMHAGVRKAMNDAYTATSAATAKQQLTRLANRLEDDHPGAAASLREGLDETLTVKGWGIGGALERTLSTTNPIENLNGRVRDTSRRVKRWRNGKMVLRWVGASLSEAEKGFRRLRGYRSMPKLVAALRALEPDLETEADAA